MKNECGRKKKTKAKRETTELRPPLSDLLSSPPPPPLPPPPPTDLLIPPLLSPPPASLSTALIFLLAADPMEISSPPSSPQKSVYKDPDDGRQRFLLELEFVQCLSNPTYIHYLAQNRYFEDEAFIGYLKYLQYWQRPEYLKFIMYPHCLFFLELLQNPNFRNAMAHPANKELAHRQQFYFWKNYRNNRLKHILPKPLPESSAIATTASVAPPATIPTPASSIPPAPPQAPPPMQYGMGPGSNFVKNDPRNSVVDKRKRK